MKIIKSLVIILLLLSTNKLIGQKVFTYIVNDFSEINPAALSNTETYQLNIKGFNSPDYNYSFNGGYLKLIVPVKKINSCFGFHTQFYTKKDFSDVKYGLSYSYKHNFTESSFLSFGVKGSLFTMKDKYYKYIINGIRYGETDFESNKFNMDAGIWFQNNNLGIGLSYNHINSPEHLAGLASEYQYTEELDLQYPNPYLYESEFNIMVNHNVGITEFFTMTNSLVMYDVINLNELMMLNINNIFELNNTFIFGSAWEVLQNNETQITFNSIIGFNLNNRYRIYLSYRIRENKSNDYAFNNISLKKVQPNLECSFIINL
jgi:hypothetical protein